MNVRLIDNFSSQDSVSDALNRYWPHRSAWQDSPFASYDWLKCWLKGFSQPQDVRLYILESGAESLALLPMVCTKVAVKKFTLPAFCSAANGHTPCNIIIAGKDHERITLLRGAIESMFKDSAVISFPGLLVGSDTWRSVRQQVSDVQALRTECRYEAPGFSMAHGWNSYFTALSKKSRDRIKNNFSRARRQGTLSHVFSDSCHGGHTAIMADLQRIDAASWQGKAGSGLFSTANNKSFYSTLLNSSAQLQTLICLTYLDRCAIAYSLALIWKGTAYILKMGYDEEHSSISPGVITSTAFFEYLAEQGVRDIDFGAGTSGEKSRWEDHRQLYDNLWLINRKRLPGWFLSTILRYADSRKNYPESPFDHDQF